MPRSVPSVEIFKGVGFDAVLAIFSVGELVKPDDSK